MIKEINFSNQAVEKINQLISKKPTGTYFRIAVKGGGCSGLTYSLDLEKEETEGDRIFDGPNDIKLYVDKKSYLFLVGTILDWSGGLNGKGFEFQNPNAISTCGCGESFAI